MTTTPTTDPAAPLREALAPTWVPEMEEHVVAWGQAFAELQHHSDNVIENPTVYPNGGLPFANAGIDGTRRCLDRMDAALAEIAKLQR